MALVVMVCKEVEMLKKRSALHSRERSREFLESSLWAGLRVFVDRRRFTWEDFFRAMTMGAFQVVAKAAHSNS